MMALSLLLLLYILLFYEFQKFYYPITFVAIANLVYRYCKKFLLAWYTYKGLIICSLVQSMLLKKVAGLNANNPKKISGMLFILIFIIN